MHRPLLSFSGLLLSRQAVLVNYSPVPQYDCHCRLLWIVLRVVFLLSHVWQTTFVTADAWRYKLLARPLVFPVVSWLPRRPVLFQLVKTAAMKPDDTWVPLLPPYLARPLLRVSLLTGAVYTTTRPQFLHVVLASVWSVMPVLRNV